MKFLSYVKSLSSSQKFIDSKYILIGLNWNDYGYYTIYDLYRSIPEGKNGYYNYPLARLYIVRKNLGPGERFWFRESLINNCMSEDDFCSFITNVENAYVLLFFLTPEERKEIISKLKIKFDIDSVKYEQAFRFSLLRNKSNEEFTKMQQEIEKIVTCPLNVAGALFAQKEQINSLINYL